MQFFSDETIGRRQRLTPEGFLVCADATLARTGTQIYAGHELPDLKPNADGMIAVERPEAEVFSPRSIAAFEGKPITLEHPDDAVDPSTWRDVAVGHVANVRRGTAPDDDVLLGDLLVTDRRAIDLVRRGGWRSLSCGYDAEYTQSVPGRATQHTVTGNHVAILPTGTARCGPRCSIGDAKARQRRKTMSVAAMGDDEFDALLAKAFPKWRTRDAIKPDYIENATSPMGGDPEGEVGGDLVAVLPGERTAYYIGAARADGSGAALYRHSTANNALNPGITHDGAALTSAARVRGVAEQTQLRSIAARNREFWHG